MLIRCHNMKSIEKTFWYFFRKGFSRNNCLKYIPIKISNKDYRFLFATHSSNINIHYHLMITTSMMIITYKKNQYLSNNFLSFSFVMKVYGYEINNEEKFGKRTWILCSSGKPTSYQISIETISCRFVNFVISPWDRVVT